MLTLFSLLVESPEGSESIREAFFHWPTIFDLVDFVLTAGIIFVLWRYRRRVFWTAPEGQELTPRQYDRLNGRLDLLERAIADDRIHRDARFDEIDEKIMRRAAEEHGFRRAVLEAEDSQTRVMSKVESGVEALRRETGFFRATLEKVPCILENGTNIGKQEDCD
jgi:hypothetical protein